MPNNIRVQSSVTAHPQSGFNNWQAVLRAQLKPKLVLRNATEPERDYVREHLLVFSQLFTDQHLAKLAKDDDSEVHYMPMGLNHMKIEVRPLYDDDPDYRAHHRVYFNASIVRLDRNGDESKLTGQVFSTYRKIHNS